MSPVGDVVYPVVLNKSYQGSFQSTEIYFPANTVLCATLLM